MTAPEEGWTDWIAHDGGPCPVQSGIYIRVRSRGGRETEGMMSNPAIAAGWDWSGCPCPTIRGYVDCYRIRKPRALRELIDLVETLPAPKIPEAA